MKTCSKCKEEKSFDEFHKHKSSKDGYRSQCKECRKEIEKKYYIENNISLKIKEKRKFDKRYIEYNRKYKDSNKEFINELKRNWSKSEKCKESQKIYYQNNSEKIKERISQYRKDNIDFILEKEKEKRKTDKYKKYISLYIKEHKSKHPHIYAWRTLLTNTLKRLNTNKSHSTIEMLGYSADELKIHLESLFKEGMSWENYGKWHIDHIKPVSFFDEDEDVSIVNSLENLQPLWAFENLSKSNKYNE